MLINKQKIKRLYFDIYGYFIYLIVRPPKEIPGKLSKIVFVCKGNVCRSPMAEYIAKVVAKNYGLEDLTYYSRGLDVSKNNPPEENTVLVCKLNGIDIANHRSIALTENDMLDADLILVMEYKQVKILYQQYPSLKNKICLLPRFINRDGIVSSYGDMIKIKDPYGGSLSDFEQCYRIISQCISNLFEVMKVLRRNS